MRNDSKPSVRFLVSSINGKVSVDCFNVAIPGKVQGDVKLGPAWETLLIVLLKYLIDQHIELRLSPVRYSSSSFGPSAIPFFDQCWNLVKNQLRRETTLADYQEQRHYRALRGIKACGDQNREIEIDPRELPPGNVAIAFADPRRASAIELWQTAQWQVLLDGMLGRCPLNANALSRDLVEDISFRPFMFGSRATRTLVAQNFPNGVMEDAIECVLLPDHYAVPVDLAPLVQDAVRVVQNAAPLGQQAVDGSLYAPIRVERVEDYDGQDFEQLRIWLAQSHYTFYTAMAFAEALAARDDHFAPLLKFAQQVENPQVPSPASCSIGTRIILKTSDEQLVVCFRSRSVKMNPDMWSASANEGVRRDANTATGTFSRILPDAARRALTNELRLEPQDVANLVLLSLHQNVYSQWGASFVAATPLTFSEVARRQPMSLHRNEHRRIAAVPTDPELCGQTMAGLGIRWYGGALESICSALSWLEAARGNFLESEQMATVVAKAGGGMIVPCDEINEVYLKKLA